MSSIKGKKMGLKENDKRRRNLLKRGHQKGNPINGKGGLIEDGRETQKVRERKIRLEKRIKLEETSDSQGD